MVLRLGLDEHKGQIHLEKILQANTERAAYKPKEQIVDELLIKLGVLYTLQSY